jgi:hypothetical protein
MLLKSFCCPLGHYGRLPWPGKIGAWTRDSITVLVFVFVVASMYLALLLLGIGEFLIALPVQCLTWGVLWVSRRGATRRGEIQTGPSYPDADSRHVFLPGLAPHLIDRHSSERRRAKRSDLQPTGRHVSHSGSVPVDDHLGPLPVPSCHSRSRLPRAPSRPLDSLHRIARRRLQST